MRQAIIFIPALCLAVSGCSKSSGSKNNQNETEADTTTEAGERESESENNSVYDSSLDTVEDDSTSDSSESHTETGTDFEADSSESGTETGTDFEADSSENDSSSDSNKVVDTENNSQTDDNIISWDEPVPTIDEIEKYVFSGINYYVDPIGGSDSNDGSQSNPYLTIEHAISVATGGETINLLPATYPLLDIRSFAGPTEPILIRGSGSSIDDATFSDEVVFYNEGAPLSANIQFENIFFADGIRLHGVKNVRIVKSLLSRKSPLVGSEDAIGRSAIYFRNTEDIAVNEVEITKAPIGITMIHTDKAYIVDNNIHDLTHDGIRVVGVRQGLIRGNHIHGLSDGANDLDPNNPDHHEGVDGRYSWSKHCDAIHVYIFGSDKANLRPNDGIIVDSNVLYDVWGQNIQFNNYGGYDEGDKYDPSVWNRNLVFRNNIFGPCDSPNGFNQAAPAVNLYFYNNTFIGGQSNYNTPSDPEYDAVPIKSKIFGLEGNNLRITPLTINAYVFNNYLNEIPNISQASIEFCDYNVVKEAAGTYSLPRNTTVYNSPDIYFNDSSDFGAKINADSYLIDTGVIIESINDTSSDFEGNSRVFTPDIGAYEFGDLSTDKNILALSPIVHNDPYLLLLDDFEDSNFKSDYILTVENTSIGASWKEPDSNQAAFEIEYSDHSSHHSNYLSCKTSVTNAASFTFIDIPHPLQSYDAQFKLVNLGVINGSGVVIQYKDADNYTYIDFGNEAGEVISVEDGAETILGTNESFKLPSNTLFDISLEVRSSSVKVMNQADELSVDINSDVPFVFGLLHNTSTTSYRILLDDLELQPLK